MQTDFTYFDSVAYSLAKKKIVFLVRSIYTDNVITSKTFLGISVSKKGRFFYANEKHVIRKQDAIFINNNTVNFNSTLIQN